MFLRGGLPCLFKPVSLIGTELVWWAKLAAQPALWICLSSSTQHWDRKCLLSCLTFFTGDSRIKLWSSCLQGKCFTGCPPGPAPFLSKHTTGLHFLETVVLNVSLADQVFLGRQKRKPKQVHSRGCRITSQAQELQEPAASLLMSLKQNKTKL